jgi:hypothetical protein
MKLILRNAATNCHVPMFSATTYTKRHYAVLGKLFIQKEPELAQKLIEVYLPHAEPLETDFTRIKELFKTFCAIEGVDYDSNLKVDTKRKFIATILHLYAPQVYLCTTDDFLITRGLATELGKVFRQTKALMSVRIREVLVWEKNYDDFKNAVAEMVSKITDEKLKDSDCENLKAA